MAAKSVVRELITLWGFEIDQQPLKELDAGINVIKASLKSLLISAAATAATVGFLLNQAGEEEQTRIAFETMLGSADAALKKLNELKQFAIRTPFTVPGIQASARQLLGMGIESDRLLNTLKILGDVSAGLSVPLSRIALNFGQIKAQAKLTGRELRDFAVAGVPLLDELAKNMGKTTGEIAKMVSRGIIGFDAVEKAFTSMTSGSGRFADLMAKQSKSFFGILSNIKDFILVLSIELGNELLPVAKEITNEVLNLLGANRALIKQDLTKLVKNLAVFMGDLFSILKAIFRVMGGVVAVFGGWGDAIKITLDLLSAFIAIGLLTGLGLITQGVFKLALAWKAMGNSALIAQVKMLLIPLAIGATVAAIALLVEDFFAFSQGMDSIFGRLFKMFPTINVLMRTFAALGKVIGALLLTPLRAVLNVLRGIGDWLGVITGRLSIMDAFKRNLDKIKNTFNIRAASNSLSAALGFGQQAENATNSMLDNSTPITGLGTPFQSSRGQSRVVNVNARNEITLNLTGMDSAAAKELVTETLGNDLALMLRETVRDGESDVER